LLADLVPRFPLKHHPDYAADLISIDTESRARVATLPVKLGHVLGFERPELATAIAKRIHERRCTVLVGASGNGKTVLARNWAAKHPGPICWIRASDLAQPGGLRAVFKLKREFSQLFPHSSQPGRIVLDGLDKCFDDVAFDEAARVLLATNDAAALVRWEVLLASASPAWVSEERRWRAGRDLWEELLGIRSFGWNYWDERMIGIVQAVREFHEGWARKHATSPYDTKHYLIFLGHKGARGTRVGGLLIYHQPAIMADSHYWAEEDIQNGFARVLKLALTKTGVNSRPTAPHETRSSRLR
jgi:hypothetical protein